MPIDIGPRITVDGEKEYRQQMQNIVNITKNLASEMKLVESEYDKNDNSMKKAKAQREVLVKQIENEKKAISTLEERYKRAVEANGEGSAEALKYKTALNKAEAQLNSYNSQLEKCEKDSSLLSKATSKLGTGLKKGIVAGAKTAAAAVAAISVAAGKTAIDIGKKALESYGEYEQLEGGVKKLFGTGGQSLEEYAASVGKSTSEASAEFKKLQSAQSTVLKNANAAYKTAGMDANSYIQNVTGFSAALIKSVGGDTEQAAKMADLAMRDIADNANTFGTKSAEEIAQVYQALAKGNFSTLDNLNLGFGGSKKGMMDLIKEANKLKKANGEMADLSIENFDDMVEAIHLIQENMGLAETTSKEAAGTLQGSISMLQNSWANLLTGFADSNADIDSLVGYVIDSISAVAENAIPLIESIALNLTSAIPGAVSQFLPTIPPMIMELLPAILQGIQTLSTGILEILPSLVETVVGFLLNDFLPGILNMLPEIISAGMEIIFSLIQGVTDALPTLIPQIVDIILTICETLLAPDNIAMIVDAAVQLIIALADGLIKAIPDLLLRLPEIIIGIRMGLLQGVAQIFGVGGDLITGLWNGINDKLGWLKDKILGFGSAVLETIKGIFGIHSPSRVMRDIIGKNLAIGIGVGFNDEIGGVMNDMQKTLDTSFTMTAPVSSLAYAGAGGYSNSSFNYNIPAINVYAAAGQSADEIANATLYKLQRQIESKRAVWR